jgi:hypothetical protein
LLWPLSDRHAFPGDRRFVDRTLSGYDDAVRRDAIAGADLDHRAYRKRIGLNFANLAVLFEPRGLWNEFSQILDAGARTTRSNALQQFSDQEQEDDCGRLLRCAYKDRADGRDRHQHLD